MATNSRRALRERMMENKFGITPSATSMVRRGPSFRTRPSIADRMSAPIVEDVQVGKESNLGGAIAPTMSPHPEIGGALDRLLSNPDAMDPRGDQMNPPQGNTTTDPESGAETPKTFFERLLGEGSPITSSRALLAGSKAVSDAGNVSPVQALTAALQGIASGAHRVEDVADARRHRDAELGLKSREVGLKEAANTQKVFELMQKRNENIVDSVLYGHYSYVDEETGERKDGAAYVSVDENGRKWIHDEKGNTLSGYQATPLEDAERLSYKDYTAKRSENATELGSLKQANDYLKAVENTNDGFRGYVDAAIGRAKTALGQGQNLSLEQFSKLSAAQQFQALIGANREDVVGPGVMTEQDAIRVMQALGVKPSDVFHNKELAKKVIGMVMLRKWDRIKENVNAVDIATRQYYGPVHGFKEMSADLPRMKFFEDAYREEMNNLDFGKVSDEDKAAANEFRQEE